jgi:hypothetical protein
MQRALFVSMGSRPRVRPIMRKGPGTRAQAANAAMRFASFDRWLMGLYQPLSALESLSSKEHPNAALAPKSRAQNDKAFR